MIFLNSGKERSIQVIGYDMDYTLVHYRVEAWEERAYQHCKGKLAAVGWHVLAGVLMLAITFALFNFGWVGGGDAKLAAATALWLGFGGLPHYGVLAAIFGGALTLLLLQLRRIDLPERLMSMTWLARLHDGKAGIPYGIALAIAGLLVYPDSAIWLAAKALR